MKTVQIKRNSKYQRDIDRSFAVIFYNLRRIRDNKLPEGTTSCVFPVAMQRQVQSSSKDNMDKRRVSFSDQILKIDL